MWVGGHRHAQDKSIGKRPGTHFNLLKPSGNFTYQRVSIQKFYVVPTLLLCVLYAFQNKRHLLPYTKLTEKLTDAFIQNKQIGFYNRGGECLLRGTY
jgi:ATP adenylyltransferase/5',5'''-P-1,P-4-tetraphosphate phosphorylase II